MAFVSIVRPRVVCTGLRAAARTPMIAAPQRRNLTGIKIMDDRERGAEAFFAHQEDERLIQKMIENNPDLDPKLQGVASLIDDGSSTADKLKMIFMKHGIPPVNRKLIADLVQLVESK
eukprot:TRINITY_DN16646_c0_g1_i1.p1 TRINITY_DN16646_c0_g1~~TRINITY_DN16646_c0_g1_i1.p1  ORF type:complete len:118 (-),score=19.80 TRINITY_DN16646_c0_g1_i1:170-523(-)